MTVTYNDIDLSFRVHPITKDILTKSNESAIKQSLHILVETSFYSRGFNMSSISISNDLFENYYPSMDITIIKTVSRIIIQEEPRVDLESVSVDSSNIQNGELIINIHYNILNNPKLRSLSVTLTRVR